MVIDVDNFVQASYLRRCRKSHPVTPLESADPSYLTLKSFIIRSYRNRGEGAPLSTWTCALEVETVFRHTGAGLRSHTSLTGHTCASNPKLPPGWTWRGAPSTSGPVLYFTRPRHPGMPPSPPP